MSDYYAVREADCTSEQIEQIFNLAQASIDDDDYFNYYEPNKWEFIIFKESEEIYQCSIRHFNLVRVELITPEEAILRLFEIYLEN